MDDRKALEALELRIRTMLPEEYQDSYQDMQPVPMRSADLKYAADGTVAWDDIWGGFCDLAMAGGPPHKGTLLEAGTGAAIGAEPDRYREVAQEICRGIRMATELEANPAPLPGWVRVACLNEGMAGWLLRAIVMENVAVRCEAQMLDLPAAPHFRLEKEIKNVVTVIAKTCHYWLGHMPRSQRLAITDMLAEIGQDAPLIAPALAVDVADQTQEALAGRIAKIIHSEVGLRRSSRRYAGWLGVECASVRAAIWMMRAMVVNNVLSRREETVLFVPVNPASDPTGDIVARTLVRVHALEAAKEAP
jgi:sirohydrochlorin cobaltochelatase